jgi:hypothetical protein
MNHRSNPRVLKIAVLVMEDKAIQCAIRRLSETSATLEVPNTVGIPENFDLVIDGVRGPCHAVWKSGTEIEVKFEWGI